MYFTKKYQDRTQGQPVTDYTETIKIKYCKKCGVSNIEDTSLRGKTQICDTCRNPEGY